MSALLTVLRKELLDHARDRRSMMTALVMPLVGPVMFATMFSTIASWARTDTPLDLPVAGAQNAPNLVAFLERNGARVRPAPADHEAQVREGKLDVVLVIPQDYGRDFSAGQTASVQLVVDNSRNSARTSVHRAEQLLLGYSRQLGALRLIARGVSPQLASPLTVAEMDLATPEKQAANALGMLPLFLLMTVFVGGMHLAIDSTAGERERGSLEPLLLNPVRRAAIVGGKWIASVLMTLLAVSVSLAGFLVALSRVPLQDLGVKVHLGPAEVATLAAILVPLMLLAAGLQMLLATFARTFKEAQTYVSLLTFIPMLPGVAITLHPIRSAGWMMLVPALGQTLLVTDVLRGEGVPALSLAIAALGAAAAAGACVAATVRLFGRERIIFGR